MMPVVSFLSAEVLYGMQPTEQPRKLRPTDVLKHEHRQIEDQLQQLTAALHTLGDQGPAIDVLDRIEHVASYIDHEMALHHRKEEQALFPLLSRFLVDENLNLDGRIADHEDLQIMHGKFREALNECREHARSSDAGSDQSYFAAQMLKGYGLYIVHLVLEHLLKEDQILFLVADHYLTDEQEAEIFGLFEKIEAEATASD